MNRILGCVLGLTVLVPLASAADWPEFRGPTRQGKTSAEHLPLSWSPTKNIAWRTELPGEGWSSPIVVGQSIYLTAAIPSEQAGESSGFELVALILEATTGELVKQVPLFTESGSAPKIHSKNSRASPTPVFDGEHVYLHFGHQGTACMTTGGEVVWKNDALDYPPVHGNGGSPVVVDNLLIFSRDGANIAEVTALDKRSGEVVWRKARDVEATKQFSFATPLLLELDGKRQLIVPGSNVVQSLDPATGDEHWRVTYDGYSVIPRPIYESGLVFVCTGYDRPSLLAIDPSGAGDVTQSHVKWRATSGIAHTPSLIGDEGRVMVVSDKSAIATCFDALTGKELWKERIGGDFSASPLLAGDRLYLLSEEGVCIVLDVSGQPQKLAENEINERCLASFAVVDDDLLLRTAQALYRIAR